MHKLAILAALLAAAAPAAQAQTPGLQWVALTAFPGQGTTQQGHHGTIFNAAMISTTKDADGYFEVFFNTTNQALDAYATVNADQARAACNKTGDASCVQGKPGWVEVLVPASTLVFPH